MAGQDRRLADQDAGDKGAEHGVDADRMGQERHRTHDDQDRRDHRDIADEVVVGPADQQRHEPPAERKAQREKEQRAKNGRADRVPFDLPALREADDDRQHDPADRVVDDGRGDGDLPQRAAHEIHLADRHRDDLDRRDRQRGAEKQGRDQPALRVRQHPVGQRLAQQNAAQERDRDAGQ